MVLDRIVQSFFIATTFLICFIQFKKLRSAFLRTGLYSLGIDRGDSESALGESALTGYILWVSLHGKHIDVQASRTKIAHDHP